METTMTESRCWYTEKVWGALSDGFSVQDTLAGCVWRWQNVFVFVVVIPRPRRQLHSSFTSWHDGPRCNKGGKSRYVCTGSPGRSSLTTALRRPRWSTAKDVGEKVGVEPFFS